MIYSQIYLCIFSSISFLEQNLNRFYYYSFIMVSIRYIKFIKPSLVIIQLIKLQYHHFLIQMILFILVKQNFHCFLSCFTISNLFQESNHGVVFRLFLFLFYPSFLNQFSYNHQNFNLKYHQIRKRQEIKVKFVFIYQLLIYFYLLLICSSPFLHRIL